MNKPAFVVHDWEIHAIGGGYIAACDSPDSANMIAKHLNAGHNNYIRLGQFGGFVLRWYGLSIHFQEWHSCKTSPERTVLTALCPLAGQWEEYCSVPTEEFNEMMEAAI
jgi:hypothetical protein